MTYMIKTEALPSRRLAAQFESAPTSRREPANIARPELGALLSVLFLMLDEAGSMVLHVSSARKGEGTTTVARDIAAAAAATGWCRVALLDANPGGVAGGRLPGLVELCERGESLALRPTLVGPVSVDLGLLSTKEGPLTRVDTLRRLYGALRRHYSLIVVDCPAILAGPQTLTLAPAADEIVLVVEAERTPLPEVRRAQEALERRGASIMGLVMNKRRKRIPGFIENML